MDLLELKNELIKIKPDDISRLSSLLENRDKIFLIGNGGSNSICSHIAQDYTKALGKPALAFSDPSRLTCYINDYGRDYAYLKFVEHFASKKDLCILISSSGNSKNIINTADFCKASDIDFIILTGFDENNELRKRFSSNSKLDFYVSSTDYGIVENLHCIFLHSVI